jgi:hypothetical protein
MAAEASPTRKGDQMLARVSAIVLVVCSGAAALAADPISRVFLPRIGEQKVVVDYEVMTYFNAGVADQREKLHQTRHELDLSVPVWQDDTNELTLTSRLKALHIDTNAWLPRTGARLPEHLWDVRLGATYRHRFDNDWVAGAWLELGSASDRPFASYDEWIINANGFLRIPHLENTAWLFLVNYANNREFWPNIPIPGFGYEFKFDKRFRGIAGVPYTYAQWKPIERLELEASYLIPRIIRARVGYRILEPLKIYAGFDWDNQRFFRADRRDRDDRLFYYEKRVVGGVRWDIDPHVWLDLAGGFAFDRFYFEGEDYSDRHGRKLEVQDGPFVMLKVGVRI